MTRIAAAIFVLIAAGADVSAHQLDEYLQAARLSIARHDVTLELDLTPGAMIAATVAAVIDSDGDGAVSPSEAEAYGRAVLADLLVKLDDSPVDLTLSRVEVPTIGEMRSGLGTIRLRAGGRAESSAGRHDLYFLNHHRPDTSVYMVNALLPDDSGITVVRQSRDPRQRESHLEYVVRPVWPLRLLWLGLGGVGLAAVALKRRGRV